MVFFKQRQPDIFDLQEGDADRHVDGDLIGCAVHDVGNEMQAILVVERNDRHHIRHFQPGQPLLMVDREAEHLALARDGARRHVEAGAMGADRRRRMKVALAWRAMVDQQRAMLAALPERCIVGVQRRQFSAHDVSLYSD